MSMMASPDDGSFVLHPPSQLALQRYRDGAGPTQVLSGHRSPIYNAKVGGVPRSMHKQVAWDVAVPDRMHYVDYVNLAREAGFTGIGLYPTRGFLHMDMGRPRHWFGTPADKQLWEKWLA